MLGDVGKPNCREDAPGHFRLATPNRLAHAGETHSVDTMASAGPQIFFAVAVWTLSALVSGT